MILPVHRILPIILSTNVNRAFSKLDEIRATFLSQKLDIFAATETWFSAEMSDEIVSIDNCTVFRNDRSDGRIGGGVAIWVKNSLQPTRFSMIGSDFGTDCVCLKFHRFKLCLLCIYIPPSSVVQAPHDVVSFIIENLDNFMLQNPDYELFLTGDFNRLNVSYLLNSFDLENTVKFPTRKKAILDLVLLSPSLIDQYRIDIGSPISTSDHCSILCSPNRVCNAPEIRQCVIHDLRESNLNAFLYELNQTNFVPLYDMNLSLEQKCVLFDEIIRACFSRCIPSNSVTMTPKDKPYLTPLIKHLINLRWEAYRQRNFPLYSHLRDKIKKLLVAQKLKWAKKAQKGAKEMWKVVNESIGTKSSKSSAIDAIIKQFPSSQVAADEINTMFAASQTHHLNAASVVDGSDWAPTVSVDSVCGLLSSLHRSKAPGIDGIPTVIYKKAASIIAAPLAHIINVSIQLRKYPDSWKQSLIVPVPKTHPPSKNELRPISLLPIPSKVCEKLVLNTGLMERFRSAFGNLQFGGLKLSSTTSALVCMHDYITSALDCRQCVGVAVLAYDFSKAFDSLGHDDIINALNLNGFPSGFIQWTQSYLSKRTQRVRLHNVTSLPLPVISGVPQGSIFGPYFFNTVIGSLNPISPWTKIIKYIDDCTYVVPIYNNDSVTLSAEHKNILAWSRSVGLSLNLKKTKFLWIPRSLQSPPPSLPDLPSADHVRILGVTFSRDLKWDCHFDAVTKLSSKRLYALRVLRPIMPKEDLRLIYQAIIRSLMEYCSPLFVKLSVRNSTLLDKLQKRSHRIICHQDCKCDLLEDLRLRRRHAAITFFNKVASFERHPLHFLCPPRSCRSERFLQPYCRTSRRLYSFFPAIVSLLNDTLP